MERVHLFGIRHHGPGSARSLISALNILQPDILLIEGPPEADDLLPLVVNDAMNPPVALLIYVPENPAISTYYPFAEYSPEWQAIRYGLQHRVEIRMMDLSQAVQMALASQAASAAVDEEDVCEQARAADDVPRSGVKEAALEITNYGDPLRVLAAAAGYEESEQWWDRLIEQRRDPSQVFQAIHEAITALRQAVPPIQDPIGIRREAQMRQHIRRALGQGFQRIGVVCGAWHTPALVDLTAIKEDTALLKGLPKFKIEATWTPWTNLRLTRRSGYGAGIESPGWYSHLWKYDSGICERWMVRVARLLRDEGIDSPPANTIDAVRLADALAALRGHSMPGLPELSEAALTTLCAGSAMPMRLIEEKLIVGESLGSVPPETPRAPLVRDFEREVSRLRLPLDAYERVIDLDLRKPNDQKRSYLLHRLNLLDIPWGRIPDAALQASGSGRGGTFHEIWRVMWQPEFSILLIDAGQWGNTIARAATARVTHMSERAQDLAALTALVEDALLADLPDAVDGLIHSLQSQAALSSDVPLLMDGILPLVNVMRYGNVRQTDRESVAQIVAEIAARICIGLPSASMALNDTAADDLFVRIQKADEAFSRIDSDDLRSRWLKTMASLVNMENGHGLVSGRACRILFDRGVLAAEDTQRFFRLGLSAAYVPARSAAWLEGFLRGSGQLLIHDNNLLKIIDMWMNELDGDLFLAILPLLRRTFSSFSQPERRGIGERIQQERDFTRIKLAGSILDLNFDEARAEAVLPYIARLLGVGNPSEEEYSE